MLKPSSPNILTHRYSNHVTPGSSRHCPSYPNAGAIPRTPLGEAIGYAIQQWKTLAVERHDSRIAIDNTESEEVIRRFAEGLMNWLFFCYGMVIQRWRSVRLTGDL